MSERNLSEHATQFSLGQLIGPEAARDAIHIAVAPVIAAVQLWPGQKIGPTDGDTDKAAPSDAPIGIVDPYLPGPVYPGQRCWMFLLPNTITGLRHEWTHPAFSAIPPTITHADHVKKSRAWLDAKAGDLDLTYNALMQAAKTRLEDDEYTIQHGSEHWRDSFGDPREFWHHYQTVTGEAVADINQTIFCCTC